MAGIASYKQSIYEAVVCGLALEQIRRAEPDLMFEEVLQRALSAQAKYRTVLERFSQADFSNASKDDIASMAAALSLLAPTILGGTQEDRAIIGSAPEKYRAALVAVFDDLNESAAKTEEIAEAWVMALDQGLTAELRDLGATPKRKGEEIADWRKALAEVSD